MPSFARSALKLHTAAAMKVAGMFIRFGLAVASYATWADRKAKYIFGSLARLRKMWKVRFGGAEPVFLPRHRRGSNRTPEHVEVEVVRLHEAQRRLGNGQLAMLLERVVGVRLARETVRAILRRRRDLVLDIERAKRKPAERIHVSGPRRLWGVDITLVWVLGIFPVWIFGVIDYQGSRLMALERIRWPTMGETARVIEQVVAQHGRPERVLTDNGPEFRGIEFELALCRLGIDHTFTRPGRPQTNGRIERLFRTFKETIFTGRWLLTSVAQVDRFCAEFVTFYNRDRPHSSYGGQTPDEVFFKTNFKRALGRVTYFDGALEWWRFG